MNRRKTAVKRHKKCVKSVENAPQRANKSGKRRGKPVQNRTDSSAAVSRAPICHRQNRALSQSLPDSHAPTHAQLIGLGNARMCSVVHSTQDERYVYGLPVPKVNIGTKAPRVCKNGRRLAAPRAHKARQGRGTLSKNLRFGLGLVPSARMFAAARTACPA